MARWALAWVRSLFDAVGGPLAWLGCLVWLVVLIDLLNLSALWGFALGVLGWATAGAWYSHWRRER